MAITLIYVQKKCIVIAVLAMFLSVLIIGNLPIKYTPVKNIFPRYSTWHEVSSIHLMKILWRPVPSGVTSMECTEYREPGVARSDVYKIPFRLFSHERANDKIAELIEEGYQDVDHFAPLMDRERKVTLLHTLMVLADALEKAKISFMALHGAVLGMYRFSSILPWDDDLDVGINISHWEEVREALSCIRGFELALDPVMRWSFFPSNGTMSRSMPGKKYPFVDIFFQAEDDTHVWGVQYLNRRRSLFPKKHVFPLKMGYLDGIFVPVPKNVYEVLKLQYVNLNECASQKNGHLLSVTYIYKIPCSWLYPVYGNFSVKS